MKCKGQNCKRYTPNECGLCRSCIEATINEREVCFSCHDSCSRIFIHKGRFRCLTCYNELAKGIVKNQNMTFFGGSNGGGGDPSPWQENAVRALEGE